MGLATDKVEKLAGALRDVAEAMCEEFVRLPTLDELLDVLTWGAHSLPEGALSDAHPSEIVGFVAAPKPAAADSAVADVDDHPFVLAGDFFRAWSRERGGSPATTQELADDLLAVLKRAGDTVVSSTDPQRLSSLKVTIKKAAARAKPGDVIAIPTGNGDYHLALLITRNSFGSALGLFRDRHPLRGVSSKLSALALPHPIYTSDHLIAERRWPIVARDEALLARFPSEPEIYHRPQPPVSGVPPVGPFGSGETAAGKMRHLTRDEAERLGVADCSYEQTYLPDRLEQLLPKLLQRRW